MIIMRIMRKKPNKERIVIRWMMDLMLKIIVNLILSIDGQGK